MGDRSDEKAKALINHIVSMLAVGDADAAMLHYIETDLSLARYARAIPSRLCADHMIIKQRHWIRDRDTGSRFLASLSKKARYHRRSRAKMLNNDFDKVAICTFQSPEQVEDLARDAAAISSKSYQSAIGVGFADTLFMRSRLRYEARCRLAARTRSLPRFRTDSLLDRVFA